jgi:hypothetical protein
VAVDHRRFGKGTGQAGAPTPTSNLIGNPVLFDPFRNRPTNIISGRAVSVCVMLWSAKIQSGQSFYFSKTLNINIKKRKVH